MSSWSSFGRSPNPWNVCGTLAMVLVTRGKRAKFGVVEVAGPKRAELQKT